MNQDRCETCRYWHVSEQNNLVGRCPLLGVVLWPKSEEVIQFATETEDARLNAELSLTHAGGPFLEPPLSEAVAIRTQRNFGCINHSPKDVNHEQ